ncbi:hypothetical protein V1477_018938 [Vespula maculifrons]|uniref:Uncharacterized protein n=1 Tax=Vespula maculifrons TaxID=7453 RepID=A0ABD2ASW0_VESMC
MDDARNKVVVDRVAAISAKDTDRNPRVPTRPTKGPAHTVSPQTPSFLRISVVIEKKRGLWLVPSASMLLLLQWVSSFEVGRVSTRWMTAGRSQGLMTRPKEKSGNEGGRPGIVGRHGRTTCATLFMVRRALDVIVADDSDDDEGVDLMDKEEVGIRSGLVDTEIVSSFVLRTEKTNRINNAVLNAGKELKFEKHVKGHNARGRATCLSKYSTRYGKGLTQLIGGNFLEPVGTCSTDFSPCLQLLA